MGVVWTSLTTLLAFVLGIVGAFWLPPWGLPMTYALYERDGVLYQHLATAVVLVFVVAGLIGLLRPQAWGLALLTSWGALLGSLAFPAPVFVSWPIFLVGALVAGYGGAQLRQIRRSTPRERGQTALFLLAGAILFLVWFGQSLPDPREKAEVFTVSLMVGLVLLVFVEAGLLLVALAALRAFRNLRAAVIRPATAP